MTASERAEHLFHGTEPRDVSSRGVADKFGELRVIFEDVDNCLLQV